MLEADAAKGHEDAADRLQNLGQLVNNVKNYCDQHGEEATLQGYLEDIALMSDIDNYNESKDKVVLMTVHSAKRVGVSIRVSDWNGRRRISVFFYGEEIGS